MSHVDAEQYVGRYIGHATRHVSKNWRGRAGSVMGIDDMVGIAQLALWQVARGWADWAAEHDVNPSAGEVFWSAARRRIDYELLDAAGRLKRAPTIVAPRVSAEGEEERFDGDVVTQLRNYQATSVLLQEIVDELALVNEHDLMLVALYFFEEMSVDHIEKLTSIERHNVSDRMHATAERLRVRARSLTVDSIFLDQPIRRASAVIHSDRVRAWTSARYGVEPGGYLRYVLACFNVDVSYVVDILDYANGHIFRRTKEGVNSGRCRSAGCELGAVRRQLCATHYRDMLNAAAKPCTVDGCERPLLAKGMCSLHYDRERRRRAVSEILAS